MTGPGPGGSGGGSGGGWNNGETDPPNQCNDSNNYCQGDPDPCDYLIQTKPADCPNPIPRPSGYAYGKEMYPQTSAMSNLLNIVDNPGADAASKVAIREALAWQTEQFANLSPAFDQVIDVFVFQIKMGCDYELARKDANGIPELMCLSALDKVLAETDKQQTLIEWILDWFGVNGFDPADLGIPQTLINLASPENSIMLKYNHVVADAKCSNWWQAVQQRRCAF